MGTTATALLSMPAAEFDLWREFRSRFGFDSDRLEWGVANAGAVAGQAWGAKVQPKDLIPEFGPRKKSTLQTGPMLAYLTSLPAAKVRVHQHGR